MNIKSTTTLKCNNCLEERKKADHSRKYAHELKNIFITISTVVNSEIETPHYSFSSFSNNTSHVADSGDVNPFIMEGRRNHFSKINSSSNFINNCKDSPFYFLKALCDYGKTLIKELNDMGKDYINNDNNDNNIKSFNISKAIDFCVDMFDTKRKYDKTRKHLEIYSDINFSYDKVVKSISETGFKMVLINLLTNSYKFTVKGKIIVRAVSMPKEKKIRILVKDSGKGFNVKEFKKNGCFYIYEKNQELNADGSGLGLTIVNEILTKFNIKLDFISNTEKGGSLFYFDLEDSYPYYDEINPYNLMTDSLTKIIKDINSGEKDKEYNNTQSPFDFKNNIVNTQKAKNINENTIENEKNDKSSNNSNKNINILDNNCNNLRINFKNNEKQRFSFMNSDVTYSPTFCNKNIEPNYARPPNLSLDKNSKNVNINNSNIYNNNNNYLASEKGNNQNRKDSGTNISNTINNNNMIISQNQKNKIQMSEKQQISNKNSIKKEEKTNFLKQIIEDNNNTNKIKTNNCPGKKGKEIQAFNSKNLLKKNLEDYNFCKGENENEDDEKLILELNKLKKIKNEKNKKNINYKKKLDKNFNKTKFYLFNLRNIFQKNEIYIHLSQKQNKKCITEPSTERNTSKKVKNAKQKKKLFDNKKKVYIIICDDEEFVARSARELIINYYIKKDKEPHVYYTPNGIECLYLMYKLSFIENRKVEYILMDLEMPYLNGIKTCNIIKSIKEANIKVFILSGDEPGDCKADGYCNKPLNEFDIINKLDKEKCKL